MNKMTKMEAAGRSAVELRGIGKSFRGKRALGDIDMLVPKGSLTVILGAAGAGKTTMLRTIAGLERPDVGQVLIGGGLANNLEPMDRNLAMIFDNLALYPNKTGFENIASPLRIGKVDPVAVDRRVREIASKLKIAHVLGRLPKTMSGGEKQRVALGRALVREPGLFLLDEPLSSLDAMLRIELRAELRRLQLEFGHTFLLATPDFAEAMAIADRVVFLREGHIVQIAAPQTLYDEPADWEVARFVGAPEINLLPAIFSPSEGGRITIDGNVVRAPAAMRSSERGAFGFKVGIRPEHVLLEAPERSRWVGEITDKESLGLKTSVSIALATGEMRALATAVSTERLRVGDRIGISFDEERILAFDEMTKARLA
jgi:multiple sugar transport system ATP-binding protein